MSLYDKLLTKELLEKSYKDLGSLKAVGRKLGVDGGTIKTYMLKYGLKFKPKARYSCNHDFFSTDTNESFYWAGFIAADGCVLDNKASKVLSIALAVKDECVIEDLKSTLSAENPIKRYLIKNSRRNPNWSDCWKSEMKITSDKLCSDLERFNIVPRKTHIYTFPEWLIDHSHVNHFIRGYNDGNGSFYISKYKTKSDQIYFSLRGTQNFLTTVRDIFHKELELKSDKNVRMSSGIYTLEYGGNIVVKKIAEYLYKNSTTHLDRKYQIALKALNHKPRKDLGLKLTKESLKEKYRSAGSLSLVAKEFNVSMSTIHTYMKRYKLDINESSASKNERFKLLLSKDNLEMAYKEAGTITGAAKKLGVGATTFKRYAEKYNITL